jgi:hypothetical protein
VLDDGGDEDEAIAGLLHDAAEDQGGRKTLERIEREFGKRVAKVVEGCSDTLQRPKPDWRPRKEAYVNHLPIASPSVRRVAAADKLHNLTALLEDVRTSGKAAFDRFKPRTPRDQVWFYKACAKALAGPGGSALATRVAECADRLEAAAIRLKLMEVKP